MAPPPEPVQKCFGIFSRKERWGPSRRGWVVGIAIGLALASLLFFGIYPFLAVTQRVDTDVLVVEGWVHQYGVRAAAEEFKSGSYQYLFTTGGPVVGSGSYINDANTSASVGADLVIQAGVAAESVQMAPSRVMGRDRTYNAAVTLRNWCSDHNQTLSSLNIVTEGAHARRTRLLFESALGSGVKIGIISVPSPDYDAKHWWRYSEGVREVLGETIAYVYAKYFVFTI